MSKLDAHGRPPEDLRVVFKRYQSLTREALDDDTNLVRENHHNINGCSPALSRTIDVLQVGFETGDQLQDTCIETAVLEWPDLQGLQFIPALLSDKTQLDLLSRMLHRDLANPTHQTNVHKHHYMPYELAESTDVGTLRSFFNAAPDSHASFLPLDPAVHKPFSVSQFLHKKLRWLTLGGQYDWTEKVYPDEKPPVFPSDIAGLVQKGFPEMFPQAAIVNVYSPGDTLALHRDVSEASDKGLVSISIGCEAVFIVGLAVPERPSVWRAFLLRSGDAIYMSGACRYAWHGVPRIFKDTCPESIRAWPAESDTDAYKDWRDWMAGKRINLNVRQMYDEHG